MGTFFIILGIVIFILLFLFFRKIGIGFTELAKDSLKQYNAPEKGTTIEEINKLLEQTEIRHNPEDVETLKICKDKTADAVGRWMLGRGCEICGVNSDIEYWFDTTKESGSGCNVRILCINCRNIQ